VNLTDEVDYLNNFIELQKIRLGDKVDLTFNISGDISMIQVEPLLLIPFVENAFKHGISYKERSMIGLTLKLIPEDWFLRLRTQNRHSGITIILKSRDRAEERPPPPGIALSREIYTGYQGH